jgi:GNAT superfamily N-acetyltransferase
MDERHTKQVRTLWRSRFGGEEDHMDEWIRDGLISEDTSEFGVVAVRNTRIVGFGICTLAGPDYARDYVGVDVDVEPWEKTGVVHINCVRQECENQGIGSELMAHRLEYLKLNGAEGVIGVSWHRYGHKDSRPLFEKFAFQPVETIDQYYAQLDGEVPCIDCEGECLCDATIYRRQFGQSEGEQ